MITLKPKQQAAVFRALADPTRREILGLLRRNQDPQAVGTLAANFRISRPAISRHLRVLRSAGLVIMLKHGASNLCRLNPKPLQSVEHWLADYQQFWNDSLRNLKTFVENNP